MSLELKDRRVPLLVAPKGSEHVEFDPAFRQAIVETFAGARRTGAGVS